MSDTLDDFKAAWQSAKKENPTPDVLSAQFIAFSKKKIKRVVLMHYQKIAILTITLMGIVLFFRYVAPFRETLSIIGMSLMIGGLVLRILIEAYSIWRTARIEISDSVWSFNQSYLHFFTYRKRIHGPVTISILVAYSVGFYLLIPEFSQYFTPLTTLLIAASYLLAAASFGYFIRMGIRNEMNVLRALLETRQQTTDQQEPGLYET
mgnify:CR=1 FL=1